MKEQTVFAMGLSALLLGAELQAQDDPWSLLDFLEGNWTGTVEGQFGTGTVQRDYAFVLDSAYLHERNVTTYPPQDRNPEGESHENWSFFSYDRTRDVHVLRQFHDETIVNRFVLNKSLTKGNRIVFDTEAIENFTAGWRARESYTVVSPDEFVEEFYLAPPDGEYEMFVTNHFRRALGEGHSP